MSIKNVHTAAFETWARERNLCEMSMVRALEREGYGRDQSRRMAREWIEGRPALMGDNGGPPIGIIS